MTSTAPRRPLPLRILHDYLFWTYERGSFHYDVMVTLILLFLFIAPHVIDFHDRPIPEVPQRSHEVLVRVADGDGHRFIYEIRIDDLQGSHTPAELHDHIAAIIRTITGDGQLEAIKPVIDPRGRTVAYAATVLRP